MGGSFSTLDYAILFVYLAAMVEIGFLFAGRQKTTEEFFLAGRRMPWLVVGMSMFASLVSASTYMGVPAFAYSHNTAIFYGVLVSPLVAPVLILLFYPFYRRLNVTTSYEYIEARFGRPTRLAVSGLFVLSRVAWLGVVVYGPALALSVATDMPLTVAILLMGVLATIYTVLGGLAAVLWTDVVQFVILAAGAVWMAAALTGDVDGGLIEILRRGVTDGRIVRPSLRLSLFEMTAAGATISWFFVFLHDYGADQVTVQRLMATPSLRATARAVAFNAVSDVVINALLLFIGVALYVYYSTAGTLPAGITGDRVMPFYIVHNLPNGASGLIITAVFAAAMSSMDSGINSVATVIVKDFVQPLRRRAATEAADVRLARVLTLALGAAATIAAFLAAQIGSIVEAWSSFMSLFAGPILAVFLFGMLWRRINPWGWAVGCAVSVAATFYIQTCTNVVWFYYLPISFAICFVVGLLIGTALPCREAPDGTTVWRQP
ncbi:MAG TPA: sodium/solute symporter [Anaerohalosphaeraceae bacterium]|jgi:SSS family transporter|nr:sodium/solute symporter [Anaerohalosphaeraceae bacterium]HRT52293.1 sodium/solute symporter [Anaerohalosphaeraceae bacterium]HRT88286.1 sodium/solute symporter [Anaerohalosphaeraceae bacterium]